MKCPKCMHPDTKVSETRSNNDCEIVRRRRSCGLCKHRFTTYESYEEIDMKVIKNDGAQQSFDYSKLSNSVYKALKKRSVDQFDIEIAIKRIVSRLQDSNSNSISSSYIASEVMNELIDLDKIAYLRFVSVHKNFDDLDSLVKEINKIK